jgi:hypothetical protein
MAEPKDGERGIVCCFCGEGFGYAGQKPDDATLKQAYEHEALCPDNPYLKRIRELEKENKELKTQVECLNDMVIGLREKSYR